MSESELGDARPARSERLPEILERWVLAGGEFRVASLGEDRARVELLRCDGGEVVDTLVIDAPDELRWASGRLR